MWYGRGMVNQSVSLYAWYAVGRDHHVIWITVWYHCVDHCVVWEGVVNLSALLDAWYVGGGIIINSVVWKGDGM
jgi:hypothetical protein